MNAVRITAAEARLGTARLARVDDTPAAWTCPTCGTTAVIDFLTFDRLAASLQVALDGAAIDDAAAARFDRERPLKPGERALDGACERCGTRFRIMGNGGELDRDGALEYLLEDVAEEVRVSEPQPTAPGPGKIRRNVTLLTLVFIAAGVAFLIPAWHDERQRDHRASTGVKTTAEITDETLRKSGPASLDVRFTDTAGTQREATFDVPLASGWHTGDADIAIIYDPAHPSTVAAASGGLRHAWGFTAAGVALIVGGLWIGVALWRRAGTVSSPSHPPEERTP